VSRAVSMIASVGIDEVLIFRFACEGSGVEISVKATRAIISFFM
jgi:hypothetical protein